MKLQSIYEKDITRHIDPAVVVGTMGVEHIKQEVEEYVFTKDILQNIYKFLNAIINNTTGKTGVWVNGYYGSGKSHFIKYLFYCLNKETRERALERYIEAVKDNKELDAFSEVTVSNISNLIKKINNTSITEIIFNIDAVAGNGDTQNSITKVLLKQLNAKRGFNSQNIALAKLVEKELYKIGQLENFKQRIQEVFQTTWDNHNITNLLHLRRVGVIDIVAEFIENVDKVSLAEALKDNKSYTIEELVFELQEYVSEQPENFRLVFLMDEVSQYIGKNSSLLLNLQTIVEEVGSKLRQKVWIVCTAQQDLSNLVNGNEGKNEDFGKIMGRFETMISLDSQDTRYITQKRLLEKNTEGLQELTKFYAENKVAIENQFDFGHSLYQNFKGAEEFYLSYPFIPYQFRLISDVFQSFSTIGFVGEGVKNTERAILGITHFTAKEYKDKNLGYFISFDNFFNEQLSKNLQHSAKSILDRAFGIDFEENIKSFAHRVVKVLFMISHLDESLKINFPATIENISFLLINNISEIKKDSYQKVEKVLNTLINNNIIQESEGKYRFLNNDGILVASSIASSSINEKQQLDYFYTQFIQKILKPQTTYNIGNKIIKLKISIDDKDEHSVGDFLVKFVVFSGEDIYYEALNTPITQININISEWFNKNIDFKKDFFTYAKTAKYLEENRGTAQGERVKTLEEFALDNSKLLTELQTKFEKEFANTSYTSKQTVNDAKSITTNSSAQRYIQMIENHAKGIYNKHEWSNEFANTNDALKNAISTNLNYLFNNELSLAEEEVNNYITRCGNNVSLNNIIKDFEKAPYAWKDIAVLHMVYNLVKKKHRTLYYHNEEMDMGQYYDKAINATSRTGIEVKSPKNYNQKEIETFCQVAKNIFINCTISPQQEVNEIIKQFHEYIGKQLIEINTYKQDYATYPFAEKINKYHRALAEIKETKSNERLMKSLIEQEETIKENRDFFEQIKEFISSNFSRYQEIKDFIANNASNIENLEEEYHSSYQEVKNFISTEQNPAERFPLMHRNYKNLKKVVEEAISNLRERVKQTYAQIFDELEREIEEKNLDSSIISNKHDLLESFDKMGKFNELEIADLKSKDFKMQKSKEIAQEIQKRKAESTGQEVKLTSVKLSSIIGGKVISSPEEVDKLLNEIRNKIMLEIGKNGSIFLE